VDKEASKSRPLRIGELARRVGVSPDTLRHYERKGVLPPAHRSEGGYREYPESIVARLLLVRRAMHFGFSLDELARILKERDRGGAPCREVRELARRQLEKVQDQLVGLAELRDELRRLLRDWDSRLGKLTPGGRAGLLESLVHSSAPASRPRRADPQRNLQPRNDRKGERS